MLKDIADRSGGVTEAGDVSRNEDRQNISTAIISDSSDKNLTIVEQPVAAGAPVKVAQVGVLPPPAGNGPVTHVKPNANGVVILPDGAKIATIQAQG
ncbi:MAG TPA: hypothetical protein PKB01_10050, partial [Xanthobacteraceae bacterium]|nr:hypothetical protein [Xanthobacteraceae bacterium]